MILIDGDDTPQPDLSVLKNLNLPLIYCKVSSRPLDLARTWDGYLIKPASAEKILTTINELNLTPTNCLVVDDDVNIAQLIELALLAGPNPVHVEAAYNGLDGINYIEQSGPDLVFLDINLPEMSGWEVLQRIRTNERLRDTPVIIYTALESPAPSKMTLLSFGVRASSCVQCHRNERYPSGSISGNSTRIGFSKSNDGSFQEMV